MIDNLDSERVFEELQEGDYGNHPRDVVEDTLENGASTDYEDIGELLTDISTAAQRIKAQDTRSRASDLVEEYCSELYLSNEASAYGGRILDYLNEETILDHEVDALAGASTYISSIFANEKVTIDEIKKVGEIGESRFRNAYKDIKSQVTENRDKPVSDLSI